MKFEFIFYFGIEDIGGENLKKKKKNALKRRDNAGSTKKAVLFPISYSLRKNPKLMPPDNIIISNTSLKLNKKAYCIRDSKNIRS